MEHRYEQRKVVDVNVLLSTPDGVTHKGHIKDLSHTGARVIMSDGTAVRNVIMEVKTAPLRQIPQPHRLRTRGYVVWTKGSEFGLIWILEDAGSPLLEIIASAEQVTEEEVLIA